MLPEERFLRLALIVLAVFIPAYFYLAVEFFSAGDPDTGMLCLAWAGFLVLACRYGRYVLRDGKDDDYE